MIVYHPGRWHVGFAFSLAGSVLPKAMLWGIPSGILAVGLSLLMKQLEVTMDNFSVSQAWAAYNAMLAFLVVFRTTQAYSRYWEGATKLKQVRGEWFGAASSLFAFCSRKEEKEEEVAKFQHLLVRLVSMLWATALEQLAGHDLGFEVLDISGLSSESVAYVRQQEDKCEVILQWIQAAVVNHIDSHVLDVPPPIITRVFQELSRGRVSLEQVQTIIDVSFPFPYAQMIAFALMANSLIMPVLCASAMESEAWCWGITTISITALWGVNYTAGELENPFNDDWNDLPLRDYCEEMNRSLSRLLQPVVCRCPELELADYSSVRTQNWGLANRTAVEKDVRAKSASTAKQSQITLRQRFLRSRKKKGAQSTASMSTASLVDENTFLTDVLAAENSTAPSVPSELAVEKAADASASSTGSVIGKPAEDSEPGDSKEPLQPIAIEVDPDEAETETAEIEATAAAVTPKAPSKKGPAAKKAAEPKRKSADPSSSSKDKGGPTQKSSPGQLQKSRSRIETNDAE